MAAVTCGEIQTPAGGGQHRQRAPGSASRAALAPRRGADNTILSGGQAVMALPSRDEVQSTGCSGSDRLNGARGGVHRRGIAIHTVPRAAVDALVARLVASGAVERPKIEAEP